MLKAIRENALVLSLGAVVAVYVAQGVAPGTIANFTAAAHALAVANGEGR